MSTPIPSPGPSDRETPLPADESRAVPIFQIALVAGLQETLATHFAESVVFVAANLPVHYAPEDRQRHITPDLIVTRGIVCHERPHFLLWEEGKSPDLVLEVTTPATRAAEANERFRIYRDVLLVPEYFLFDPYGDTLDPRLQGYRLHSTGYLRIEPDNGLLHSRALRLWLHADGVQLRFFDPDAWCWLPASQGHAAVTKALEAARRELAAASLAQSGASRLLATAAKAQHDAARLQAEAAKQHAQAAARQQAAAHAIEDAVRLQNEIEQLGFKQAASSRQKPDAGNAG